MKSSGIKFAAALASSMAMIGCTALLGSYDVGPGAGGGDTPTPDGDIAEGSSSESSLPDGSMTGMDVDAAPPLMCKTGETKCPVQGVCAVLGTDVNHCGACGHSCGGGGCNAGVCRPVKIYDGTLAVGPVAVGHGLNFFFGTSDGSQDNRLLSCPVATGCTLTPKQLVVRQYPIEAINAVNASNITFISAPTQTTQRPAIYACVPAGCPAAPTSFTGDGLNGIESRLQSVNNEVFFNLGGSGPGFSTCALAPGGTCTAATFLGSGSTRGTHGFAIDATDIYFVDSSARGSTIAKCAQTDTACVPVPVVTGDQSTVQSVAVYGGKLFWIFPGRDDFHEGKLLTCDLPACATVKLVAGGLDTGPTNSNTVPLEDLYVDDSGAYWFTRGNILQHCLPGGCLGGPRDFAGAAMTPLLTPHSLTADDSFIYWAETTAVWRLAKP